jgi:predicted deacylase
VELIAPAAGRLRHDRRAGEVIVAGDVLGAILDG